MKFFFKARAALVFAAALFVFATAALCAQPSKDLPEIRLKDWAGKERLITRNPEGGNVLLFFWSVFCPNCKEVMPKLAEYSRSGAKGTALYAVNVDGENFMNAVKAFMEEKKPKYTVVLDRFEKGEMVAADPLMIAKTPTLVLARGDGKVLLRQEVTIDLAEVEKKGALKK